MAFKKVVDLDADTCTALGGLNKKTGKKNPTQAEGYYLGAKEVDSPKSKSGKAYLHILQTEEGTLGVWGKTDLDRKMKQVKPGEMIRITQSGVLKTKNGDMYKYQVEVDSDNTIEVNFGNAADDTAGANDADYSDEGEESDIDGEEEQLDETPPARTTRPIQVATPPSASQQAKVAALLNKSRQKSA